jgi:hypothetical protein
VNAFEAEVIEARVEPLDPLAEMDFWGHVDLGMSETKDESGLEKERLRRWLGRFTAIDLSCLWTRRRTGLMMALRGSGVGVVGVRQDLQTQNLHRLEREHHEACVEPGCFSERRRRDRVCRDWARPVLFCKRMNHMEQRRRRRRPKSSTGKICQRARRPSG